VWLSLHKRQRAATPALQLMDASGGAAALQHEGKGEHDAACRAREMRAALDEAHSSGAAQLLLVTPAPLTP
jgi:hypothetical protein